MDTHGCAPSAPHQTGCLLGASSTLLVLQTGCASTAPAHRRHVPRKGALLGGRDFTARLGVERPFRGVRGVREMRILRTGSLGSIPLPVTVDG